MGLHPVKLRGKRLIDPQESLNPFVAMIGLGIIHTDVRNRDSLALDLLEPLRPLVDRHVKPDVVHFSGHSASAGLAMEDNDGFTRMLTTDELATLLSVSSRRIRLAVFNSCESVEHAEAALSHLDAAIGMEQSIDDAAAQSFAGQLYSSIAFGLR